MTARPFTILDFISDRKLAAPWFKDKSTWLPWFVFLSALFGLPISSKSAAEIFHSCTGRTTPPQDPFNEAYLICGRRAGKSFILSLIGVYLAVVRDYRPYLQPGERATIAIIARDRRQARVIFRFVSGFFDNIPMLKDLVERESDSSFDLSNSVTIEVHTASFRAVRGYTLAAALVDEIAYFPTDETAAEPDYELLNSLRPAMATIPGAMLLCASSPYAQRGVLYQAFREHHGKDDAPVLVWKAPTRAMNSTVPESVVQTALARDASSAKAEYLAEFRSDVETFVPLRVVESCIQPDFFEQPYISGTHFHAFVDPSGGSADSFTLAISFRDKRDKVHIAAVREYAPPFSPADVTEQICDVLQSYRIRFVTGDRYAGEFPRELFRKRNVEYRLAERQASELYRELLPLLNGRVLVLPDNPKVVQQLVSLERRTSRGGRDIISHPRGQHDDLANAVAGAAYLANARSRKAVFGTYSDGGYLDSDWLRRHYGGTQIERGAPDANPNPQSAPCSVDFSKIEPHRPVEGSDPREGFGSGNYFKR